MKQTAAWLLLILAGCATPEVKLVHATPDQIKTADYGKYPKEYKLAIAKFMLLQIHQPSGAEYHYKSKPRKKWVPGPSAPQFGYGVCADIAAPKGGGKLEKARSFFFLLKNEAVILFLENPVPFYCQPIADPSEAPPQKAVKPSET